MPLEPRHRPHPKPENKKRDFRIKRMPGGKLIEPANKPRLYISTEGRALLRELGDKGKALLRGELPLKKELITQGTHGSIYRVRIAGKDFALKELTGKGGGTTENGIGQMEELRGDRTTEGKRHIERPVRTFLAGENWLLMELVEGTLLKNIRPRHPLYDKLMDAIDEDIRLEEIWGNGFLTKRCFAKYHEKTRKFELILIDP